MVKIINMFGSNYYNVNNPKFIVIHYTGNADTSAKANATFFKNCKNASAHYVVDSKEIYRCIPENKGAWHAGNKAMNQQSIGIEICCKKVNKASQNASDTDWYFDIGTLNNCLDLIEDIKKRFPNVQIIRHYDVTKKLCPAPFVHNVEAWNTFIKHAQNNTRYGVQINTYKQVRVIIPNLNIRKGPGTQYEKVAGYCPMGVFTITNQMGDWGQLKSGAGWINLKYTLEVKKK